MQWLGRHWLYIGNNSKWPENFRFHLSRLIIKEIFAKGGSVMERKHYGAIDGLRTIACVGIVMMHLQANNAYAIISVSE